MDEKTKEDFIGLFNQGFEEIVLPELESIREEMAVMTTKKDLDDLEYRLTARIDRVADKANDAENRLEKLEDSAVITHNISKKN